MQKQAEFDTTGAVYGGLSGAGLAGVLSYLNNGISQRTLVDSLLGGGLGALGGGYLLDAADAAGEAKDSIEKSLTGSQDASGGRGLITAVKDSGAGVLAGAGTHAGLNIASKQKPAANRLGLGTLSAVEGLRGAAGESIGENVLTDAALGTGAAMAYKTLSPDADIPAKPRSTTIVPDDTTPSGTRTVSTDTKATKALDRASRGVRGGGRVAAPATAGVALVRALIDYTTGRRDADINIPINDAKVNAILNNLPVAGKAGK